VILTFLIKMRAENIIRYEVFILIGLLISIGTTLKLLGVYAFSSDWFWFLAGIALIVEGTIALLKDKRFKRKYKIIERAISS